MATGDLRLVYSVAEAAELLGIGRSTAYELVARGELPATRLGSRVVVSRPTLTALLGMEPPLPGELDAARQVVTNTGKPAHASKRPKRRRQPARTQGQTHLPFTA